MGNCDITIINTEIKFQTLQGGTCRFGVRQKDGGFLDFEVTREKNV